MGAGRNETVKRFVHSTNLAKTNGTFIFLPRSDENVERMIKLRKTKNEAAIRNPLEKVNVGIS